MELVWKKAAPTVTVREIYDILRHERQIAYTTVMTTMVRLAEKGLLRIVDRAGLCQLLCPSRVAVGVYQERGRTRARNLHQRVSARVERLSGESQNSPQRTLVRALIICREPTPCAQATARMSQD